MSSKIIKKGNALKKVVKKVEHRTPLRVIIPAGMANAKPPLGSQLGQVKKYFIHYIILYFFINLYFFH